MGDDNVRLVIRIPLVHSGGANLNTGLISAGPTQGIVYADVRVVTIGLVTRAVEPVFKGHGENVSHGGSFLKQASGLEHIFHKGNFREPLKEGLDRAFLQLGFRFLRDREVVYHHLAKAIGVEGKQLWSGLKNFR
jgi:hypothetical protein